MYAIPAALVFDVAAVVQDDRINQAAQARLIREATRGRRGRFQIFGAIRRAFGGALIAVGESVHGERADAVDHSQVPSTGTLRLAR